MKRKLIFIFLINILAFQVCAQLMPIQNKDRWGYIDLQGNVQIPFQYGSAGLFSEGLAHVATFGQFSYINEKGNTIIEEQYDYASPFKNGKAIVRKNGLNFLINKSGNEVFSFKGKNPCLHNGYISFQEEGLKHPKLGVISLDGKYLLKENETCFDFNLGDYPFFIIANDDLNYYLKDIEGQTVSDIGRYANLNECVKGNLFSRNSSIKAVYDTLRVFGQDGKLIKKIIPDPAYYFNYKQNSNVYGFYSIIQIPTNSSYTFKENVYNSEGELIISFNPDAEKYDVIANDCMMKKNADGYQMVSRNGNVLLDSIMDFSYYNYGEIELPKVFVTSRDSLYALSDFDGNVEYISAKLKQFSHDNRSGFLIDIKDSSGNLITYPYYGRYQSIYTLTTWPRAYYKNLLFFSYNDDKEIYTDRSGNEIFVAKNNTDTCEPLFPSPYYSTYYHISSINSQKNTIKKKNKRWALEVSEMPSFNNIFGCYSRIATLINSSKDSISIRKIEYIEMEIKNNEGKWVGFDTYQFDYKLHDSILKVGENLQFPIYDMRGAAQTEMRLIVIISSNKKKTRIYSNSFPVGVNPDFFIK